MGDHYEDIYEHDDPNFKRQIFRHSDKSYREVLENRRNMKRESDEDSSKSSTKIQYFNQKEQNADSDSIKADIIVDKFKDNIQNIIDDKNRYYKRVIDEEADQSKFEFRNMDSFNLHSVKNIEAFNKRLQNHYELSLTGKSNNPGDVYNIQEEAFSKSFSDLHGDLEYAINKRKELANSDFDKSFEEAENAMNIAMNIYNKIQNIKMSGIHSLDATPITDEQLFARDSTKEQLRVELAKLKVSLDDNTSPSISVIKELHSQGLLGLENSKIEEITVKPLAKFYCFGFLCQVFLLKKIVKYFSISV